MAPADLTATEALRAFERRALSPVELLDDQLRRIEAGNGAINAFTLLDAEGARREAKASEARWMRGAPQGFLDGITFTAKDNLMVAGYPWRRGSLATPRAPVGESSPIVARCREAGAVFVGLTAMPEFGLGPVTISPLSGITRNPWDTRMQAGGSSGGSAAAVAAGFCTLSVATDAGGSIRIPAALSGAVGFKPSGGRVPVYPASSAGALSCHGPITRSVSDAALLLTPACRSDERDPFALPADGTDYVSALEGGIRGARIAFSQTLGYAPKVHPEVARLARDAAAVLAELGANVEERDPGVEDPIEVYVTLLQAGYQHSLRHLDAARRELLSPALREILDGPQVALADYLRALEFCQALARRLHAFHRNYDLLVTPTVAVPAFPAERSYPEEFEEFRNRRAWTPFTSPFNLTQQPAISVPAGLTSAGLPVGLHIVGPRAADAKVLRAAAAYEGARAPSKRPVPAH
jgi:aspartyl-tRNA(Asn)/glutamyl-tRNA(Gln) amidotransferase subunit A